jgi:MFS family permease
MNASPAASRTYKRGLVAACGLGMAVSWNISNIAALPGALAREYGVALASIALLTSCMLFAEVFTTLPVGRLIDRIGPWRVGVLSLLVVLAANAGLAASGEFATALALRFVVGAGVSAGFIAGSAYVSLLGGSALTQGVYGSVSTVAAGIALVVVPALRSALGWRAPFLTAAVVSGLAICVLAGAPRVVGGELRDRLPLRKLMLDSRIVRFGAVQAAGFGLGIVVSAWTVTILQRRGGVPAQQAGVAAGLIFVAGIVGRPLGGFVLRRYPVWSRSLFVCGMFCGAIGTMLLCIAKPPPVPFVGGALVGIATGLPFGAVMSCLAREFPEAVGSAFAVVSLYTTVAVVVLTPIVGASFSAGGSGVIGFALVAVLWILAAFAIPSREFLVRSWGEPRGVMSKGFGAAQESIGRQRVKERS